MKEVVKQFKSNYILRCLKGDYNPFTPNIINIYPDRIEYKRRNWHLISVDTENLHFYKITGISIDKHIFGATITIKSTGSDPIYVNGLWKSTAKMIDAICSEHISTHSNIGSVTNAIDKAIKKNSPISVADELSKLKSLMEEGVITSDEFEAQKQKLLNQ